VEKVEKERESARRHTPLQATPTMAAAEAGISVSRVEAHKKCAQLQYGTASLDIAVRMLLRAVLQHPVC